MFATLADQIHHTRRVYRNHQRLIDLQQQYDESTDHTNRAVIAERAAFVVGHQIEHLTASRLARAVTSLPLGYLEEARADWLGRSQQAWAEAAAERR